MSIEIKKNIDLSHFSTFKIGGPASFFVEVKNRDELIEALSWAREKKQRIFILGAGSNVLFSDEGFSGLVIKNEIKGIDIVEEKEDYTIIRAYSGEVWSKLVNFAVERGLYGLENTFYIPGSVGASAIQNIGAYGAEMKDCFHLLKAINIESQEERVFNLDDCQFDYRDSVFKNEFKDKYFILYIEFKLKNQADLNLSYPDIQKALKEREISQPSLKELTRIIKDIRDSKIPNPSVLANAGSFFKNTVLDFDSLKRLKKKFPDIKYFVEKDKVKIPTAWLIDQCGLKGFRYKDVGVYEKQALIIVNYGKGSQEDILFLVDTIKKKVKNKFDIDLESEVRVL
jgi:UDP-N-acetylmuramate dehydrogenase